MTENDQLEQMRPASTMTVRVVNRGTQRSYEGVWITTVTIADTCPACGGPRGKPYSYYFMEDGEGYTCDRWDNPCGHVDGYGSVLVEAGIHRPRES